MSTTVTKKYHTVAETMERLAMGKTTVYKLAGSGMLTLVHLPSPKKARPGVEQREGIPRVTTESIERYERGETRVPGATQALTCAAVTPRRMRTRTPGKTLALTHFSPRR